MASNDLQSIDIGGAEEGKRGIIFVICVEKSQGKPNFAIPYY